MTEKKTEELGTKNNRIDINELNSSIESVRRNIEVLMKIYVCSTDRGGDDTISFKDLRIQEEYLMSLTKKMVDLFADKSFYISRDQSCDEDKAKQFALQLYEKKLISPYALLKTHGFDEDMEIELMRLNRVKKIHNIPTLDNP